MTIDRFLAFLGSLAVMALLGYFYNNWAYRDKDDRGPELTWQGKRFYHFDPDIPH